MRQYDMNISFVVQWISFCNVYLQYLVDYWSFFITTTINLPSNTCPLPSPRNLEGVFSDFFQILSFFKVISYN
jgi:hypothetical protein